MKNSGGYEKQLVWFYIHTGLLNVSQWLKNPKGFFETNVFYFITSFTVLFDHSITKY